MKTRMANLLCVAAALVVGMALGGCGSLSVTMEVLDPQVIHETNNRILIEEGLPVALGSTPETIAAMVQRAKNEHYLVYVKLAAAYSEEAKSLPAPKASALQAMASDLPGLFRKNFAPSYDALQKDLVQYAADLKQLYPRKYFVSPTDPEYPATIAILRLWRERVTQLQNLARNDNRLTAIKKLPLGEKEDVKDQVVVADAATAELTQLSIQESPLAYAVASAPDSRWADKYNKVYSRGDLGAFDVAIKLDPATGNYLLKGLAFDPSDVAVVASKVGVQAVLLAAQIAGVPVKVSTAPAAGTPGAALAASSGALADAQADLEARRAKDDARKSALLALANAIVNEETNLQSTDAEVRRNAMAAIRTAFEKREAILKPSATSQ